MMPFIKGEKRERLDEELAEVALEINRMAGLDAEAIRRRGPLVSYAIMKLLTDVYGSKVEDMIEAIGVLEETKMTYYTMYMLPLEQRILLARWLEPDGSY